jgi:hypothetical protein
MKDKIITALIQILLLAAIAFIIFGGYHAYNALQFQKAYNENVLSVQRVPNGLTLDGSTDYFALGAGLTGATDVKTGTISTWLRLADGDGSVLTIFQGTSNRFYFRKGTSNKFQLSATNTSGTTILNIYHNTAHTASVSWIHVMASWNLATPITHMYVNGSTNKVQATATDANIDYTLSNWHLGVRDTLASYFDGEIADFWFDDSYMDLSSATNRAKFITSGGYPVDLGTDGSTPTGSAPLVYFPFNADDYLDNKGTGGEFTEYGTPDLGPGPASNQCLDDDEAYVYNQGRSGNRFTQGERWYECERCGFTFKESDTVIEEQTGRRVCTTRPGCLDPDVREAQEMAYFIRSDGEES